MQKNQTKALVICGHGSSVNLYKNDFKKSFNTIRNVIKANCFFCFIEKNKPSIDECLKILKKDGYTTIFFFPFLIFHGKHFESDIKLRLKKLAKSLELKIILIDKISLINDVLPIMSKKIKKLLKKNRTNILATFCSTSKNTNVVKELEAYTSEIGNLKGIKKVFSNFVGNENSFLSKINEINHKKSFLIIHPIFLFEGYLQKKNLDFFTKIENKEIYILSTLMKINDIDSMIVKKLKSFF